MGLGAPQSSTTHRAFAMSTRPTPLNATPSARSRFTCCVFTPGAHVPSARSTRHHGASSPCVAITFATCRAPPPTHFATSP